MSSYNNNGDELIKYKIKYSAQELENKLDKVNQEYLPEEKEKLKNLENYDDSQIKSDIETLFNKTDIDNIVSETSDKPVKSSGIYDFVNSSVSTNTANFIGTFNSLSELESYSGEITNNDYAFVIDQDSAGNTLYKRYKYTATRSSWEFEYSLNNSSYTANQWATINSGLTSEDKEEIKNKANSDSVYSKEVADSTFLKKDGTATKAISDKNGEDIAENFASVKSNLLFKTLPENHNAIFRGDDLFAKGYTIDDICAMISDGSFSDIYIGDYFTLSGTIENVPCFVEQTDDEGTKTMVESTQTVTYNTKFRIAGLDTYLNTGDTAFTKHHAVIVPDGVIGNNRMNSTNITTGGYAGSFMHTSVLPVYDTHFTEKLNNHLLSRRDILTNSVSGSAANNWGWYSIKSRLMSEPEVYGTRAFGGTYDIGTAYNRFPLFNLAPKYICNKTSYWLRAVTASTHFANVTSNGYASHGRASIVLGVRPAFVIG